MVIPERKHPRLKSYDYSLPGCYYITIHTVQEHMLLSGIERPLISERAVVRLTEFGAIAQQQLMELEKRYPYVKIDKYAIMPTHIHAIIRLLEETAGPRPRPTLSDILCAYKSLTTRAVNQRFNTPGQKLFQTSFYESVLRNEAAYQECWRYIDENPEKWLLSSKKD